MGITGQYLFADIREDLYTQSSKFSGNTLGDVGKKLTLVTTRLVLNSGCFINQ